MNKGKRKDIDEIEPNDTAAAPQGKNYLLAIAIDKYDEINNKIPRLSNCVKDAKDIIRILQERFGFEKEHITTVFDEEATLGRINEELEVLSDRVTSEDNVIVYFSGHGYYKKTQKEGYLIPVDGIKKNYWGYLSNSNFLTHIRAVKSFHTFLIIDSCFSGSLFSTKSADYEYSERAERFPSRWALAAGKIETVSDGYHGENSPFAQSIITFLEKTEEMINPVSDFIIHVKKATSRNSDQTPAGGPLFKVGDMDGEFVFRLKKDEATDWKESCKLNTIVAYQEFISKYPDGKHTVAASTKLEALKAKAKAEKEKLDLIEDESEKKAYEAAMNSNDEEQLIHFLETSTNNSYKKKVSKKLQKLELETEAKEAWEALNKNSFAALSDFLIDYPQSIYKKEAKELQGKIKEDKAWKKSVSDNNISSLQAYLKVYPSGQYVQLAMEQIRSLEQKETAEKEQEVWEDVKRKNIISAYQSFLQLYPEGEYAGEAKKAIGKIRVLELKKKEELREKKAWDAAKRENTAPAYHRYFGLYANGKYADEARKALEKISLLQIKKRESLKEQEIWYAAKQGNLTSDYQRYLQFYPSGKYAEFANKRIENLRIEKAKEEKNIKSRMGIERRRKAKEQAKIIVPEYSSFRDPRDGQEYKTIRLKDGKVWMAQNLNFEVPKKGLIFKEKQCWHYDDDPSNGAKYGRLYTWEAAKMACPPGWHLPSSKEWRMMAKQYGGCSHEAKDGGVAAYKALIVGGSSGFVASLGGYRGSDGSYRSLNEYGFYWSSIDKSDEIAWHYGFNETNSKFYRGQGIKAGGRSCRYIKD